MNDDGSIDYVPDWVDDPDNRDVQNGQVMIVIHLDATDSTLQMWTNFADHNGTLEILEECIRHAREIIELEEGMK